MNNRILFTLWGIMLALCAGLGFIPEPAGAAAAVLTALALASFLPPLLLVSRAKKGHDQQTLSLIRNLALASLILTVLALILSFLSYSAPENWGNFLHYVLIVVSTPMVCSRYWAASLFLWAYLMVDCISALKKK